MHEWYSDSGKLANASDGACFVGVVTSLVILIKTANILSNIPEVKLYANRPIPQPTVQVKTYNPSTLYVNFVHIECTGTAKTLHLILNFCVNATDNIQSQNCAYMSTYPTLILSYPDSGDETNAIYMDRPSDVLHKFVYQSPIMPSWGWCPL